MTTVEAVFMNGVFVPLGEVNLPEGQRVRLHVEPLDTVDPAAWLEEVRRLQERLDGVRGLFTSAEEIAHDRLRDI